MALRTIPLEGLLKQINPLFINSIYKIEKKSLDTKNYNKLSLNTNSLLNNFGKTYCTIQPNDIGQISPLTHPELMKKDEITPGITSLQYELRRAKLIEEIPDKGIIIVGGYGLRYMSKGIFYKFHQNTDLLYLCGFNQPDAALILEKDVKLARKYKMILFCLPKNKELEKWDGPRCGLTNAKQFFKADEAYSIDQFKNKLQEILDHQIKRLNKIPDIYTNLSLQMVLENKKKPKSQYPKYTYTISSTGLSVGNTNAGDNEQSSSMSSFLRHTVLKVPSKFCPPPSTYSRNPDIVKSITHLLQHFRTRKSSSEIKLLKKVGDITGEAFIEVFKHTKHGLNEGQLEALFEYQIKNRGAQCLSYIPVVASGKNALYMHYTTNNCFVKNGDLILMDAGAELNGYVSDVTRTWPVNGKFSEPQKELYQIILNIQKKCINMCTEKSRNTLNKIHQHFIDLLVKDLSKLFNRQITWIEANELCPHHISHYMGMDVHDTEEISRSIPLKKGMVVTMEPGIYVPFNDLYPKRYQGIGIRIEDNIAIDDKVGINLSKSVPKEIAEIEDIMAKANL